MVRICAPNVPRVHIYMLEAYAEGYRIRDILLQTFYNTSLIHH